jgi:hypothetical protein
MLPTSTSPVAMPMRISHSICGSFMPSSSGISSRSGPTRALISSAAAHASRASSAASTNGGPQ